MIEIYGDLFELDAEQFGAIVITGSDVVHDADADHRRPYASMGAGVSRQARLRWPGVDEELAELVRSGDQTGACLLKWTDEVPWVVFHFLVKRAHHTHTDLATVVESARQLRELVLRMEKDGAKLGLIAIPRPGCGAGGADWSEVKPLMAPIFPEKRWAFIDRASG